MSDAPTASKVSRKQQRPEAVRFRFGYLLHDVSRNRRTLIDHWMKPLGITRAQWPLLSALSRGGNDGMMQVDLARLLVVGKVTIGGPDDRLERGEYVQRRPHPNARRAKLRCAAHRVGKDGRSACKTRWQRQQESKYQ